VKDYVTFGLIVGAFVIGGFLLMTSGLLPEEHADEFHSLSAGNLTLQSDIVTIKEATEDDNTHAYAVNEVAARAVTIALESAEAEAILQQVEGSAVTIVGVQPTLLVDSTGKLIHSGTGQVIITSIQERADGRPINQAVDFASMVGKNVEARQEIWNLIIDMDNASVVSVKKDADRKLQSTVQQNFVYAEINVFLPHAVKLDSDSTVRWINHSSVPHNVVGTYAVNSSSDNLRIDSGFIDEGKSFQYTFSGEGVFVYHCTIHSEEGMAGIVVIEN
jgi:plastocyanin